MLVFLGRSCRAAAGGQRSVVQRHALRPFARPPPRQICGARKKSETVEVTASIDLSDDEAPAARTGKPRGRRKKTDPASGAASDRAGGVTTDTEAETDAEGLSDVETSAEARPSKPRRTRRKRDATALDAVYAATDTEGEGETDAEGLSDSEGPPARPRRTRKKRAAAAVADAERSATDTEAEGETDVEGLSDSEGSPAKPRRARAGRSVAPEDLAAHATDTEVDTDAEGLSDQEEQPPAKPRRGRKKRVTAEADAASAATDTETDAEGLSDSEQPRPKPRRGRKRLDAVAERQALVAADSEAGAETEFEDARLQSVLGRLSEEELLGVAVDRATAAAGAAELAGASEDEAEPDPWEVDEHGDLVPVFPMDRTDVFALEGGPSSYLDEAQAEREVRPRYPGWRQTGQEEALVDEKPGFVSFSFGTEMQFLISELPDGRLNLREVFLTGGDDPERIRPTVRGEISAEPGYYHLMPCEAHIGGDQMKEVPAEWVLEHVIITKVLRQDPFELDFSEVYCFDCARQMFYRVATFDAHEEIHDPVLRFRPKERVFFIDDADSMPSADQVHDEWEARDMGLEVALDPELEEAIAEMSLHNLQLFGESGELSELAMTGAWQRPGEEEEEEEEVPEFDNIMDDMMNEDPDVPAVDLA